MKRVLAGLLAAVILPSEARAAESLPPISRSVEVSITNIDVVVTDAKGRPVSDLGPLDFIVTQEGKAQAISNFSFVRNLPAPAAPMATADETPSNAVSTPAAAAPGPAGARIVVLLDFLHMTVGNRNRAVASLAEFLPKTIGPRVEVQIVTWDRALRTRGSFTNDPGVLTAVLSALKEETALGEAPVRERSRLFSQIDDALAAPPAFRSALISGAISTLRGWCDAQASDLDATLSAARALVGTVSGVEGRKILIFATEKLTPSPGREIWDYLLEGVDRLARGSGGQRVLSDSGSLTGLTWKDFDRTASFQRFAEAANGAGVSLFMVDAAGLTGDTRLSAEFAGTAGSVNEGLATLDAESALRLLADETGGAAIVGRNNLALALEGLESAWTAYYSLGFESSASKPGVPRSIRVSVRRPGVRVLTRRNVVERTPEQKVADAVLSGVHFPKTLNPLRASLSIGTAKQSGKMWLVPFEFKVPFEKLTLIPQGGRLKGALLFTTAAATPDGRISPVTTERATIDVPESDLASLPGKVFTYSSTLKLRPGPQIISAALTDEISRLSSFVQPHVLIGDKPKTP